MLSDDHIQSAIREFADFIGTTVTFERDGSCAFRFAQSGLFFLVGSSDELDLVLTLSRALGSTSFNYEGALRSGALDIDQSGHLVSVGINQTGDLVLSLRLLKSNVNLQTLLSAFDLLKRRQKDITA